MSAPTNTYDSQTDLFLGHVPEEIEDPVLYEELLAIHNAMETLLKSSDAGQESNFSVVTVTGNYTVVVGDVLILVDTTAGNVTITLPLAATTTGRPYEIVQIKGSKETLIIGTGGELVDDDAGGITIDLLEALPVKSNSVSYFINN